MRSLLRWALALILLCAPALVRASAETDALNALDAANAKVMGLSAIKSPSATNLDSVKGELSSLGPFFSTVASRLSAVPVDGSSRLLELGGSISAKIQTGSQVSVLNIGVLIDSCRGIVADLDAWKALLPEVERALQSRVDQQTQALIRDQVNQTFPTPFPTQPPAPVPTGTPIFWPSPTAVPTQPPLFSTPTPYVLPPVDGGYVPPPQPTFAPTPVPVGQPTPVPTPRAAAKLPVPVAAGHNNQSVWVANVQADSVGVMDAGARRFTKQIPVGNGPSSLALDDGDNNLIVANGGSNNVTLINARSNAVIKTIGVGAHPVQVLVTHGGKAYVACQDGRRIDVIDLQRQLLVKSITLSSRPGHMDLPNSSQNLYVSLPDEDSLAVIDTGIDEVVATVAE